MRLFTVTAAAPLVGMASAWAAPGYGGYRLAWSETFTGTGGILPDQDRWNIIDGDLNVNNELQTYRANPHQVQLSGGETLQLVPWRDASACGGWTSGRIESRYTFTPKALGKTMVEAQIRFGSNPTSSKQGIWPAFWMLGDSMRHGTPWPACGELDIMETVNGQLTGYGTVHCHIYPGGICNEPSGRAGTVWIPDQSWHRWRIVWDRPTSDWWTESITWYLDDQQFHQIKSEDIGNYEVWASLARSPLYIILNVAVGGDWPGYPNDDSLDGYGSMMEVSYVVQYYSL